MTARVYCKNKAETGNVGLVIQRGVDEEFYIIPYEAGRAPIKIKICEVKGNSSLPIEG